ncbi:MAG: VWA domain-containing protein [Lachnospiraceae bacterium]|nr:VWA domain-containing protein [Lachnospiraceae bacterium]
MIINPIIPVWLMGIICVFFLFFKRKGMFNYIRQILIILLLFVINLRIMIGNGETETVTAGADVLFVVDNTISMFAEDYDGTGRRMDAVREHCRYITEQLPGASYSVVAFGNSVQSLTPYTTDASVTNQAIASLNGQATLYATGTSLNQVLEGLPAILDDNRDNYQVVFFISDGEITGGETLKEVPEIRKYVDAGAVLGYGTESGGRMRAVSFIGSEEEAEYLTYYDDDFEEKDALSKIDEGNLEKIAENLGVKYVHMTDASKIDDSLSDITRGIQNAPKSIETDSTEGYADIYYWFVLPLLLLLIFDFIYYRKRKVI